MLFTNVLGNKVSSFRSISIFQTLEQIFECRSRRDAQPRLQHAESLAYTRPQFGAASVHHCWWENLQPTVRGVSQVFRSPPLPLS